MRDIKIDPNKKDIVKTLSITKEERERFEGLQNVIAILNTELDGIKQLMLTHAISIRKRLDVKEDGAPVGYERFVDFNEKYDMVVIDRPVLKESQKDENLVNEAKKEIN